MSERLLTAEEVAELLALLESWVREATPEGRIPYLALGRYRRYERAAIEAWLAEQRGGPSVKQHRWDWKQIGHLLSLGSSRTTLERDGADSTRGRNGAPLRPAVAKR